MKNLSRDAKLTIGILALLITLVIVVAANRTQEQQLPPLSNTSSAPNGALALKLWLQELGYDVNEQVLSEFQLPEDVSMVLLLEPEFPTEDELDVLDEWVDAGGTLLAIGQDYGMYSLIDHYQFDFALLADEGVTPVPSSPLLHSPPVASLPNITPQVYLRTERTDVVTLLTQQGNPILVTFEQGQGRVILGTMTASISNAGLKQEGNPELVLNLIALAPKKGTVWFDEWHHGVRNVNQATGPGEFLTRTPVGHAILFATFAIFLTLFIQGRGFGRPVLLKDDIRRRGAMDHITGIANLSRRAAHRSAVMMHYHQQIKRKLGQRYRLNPGIDDAQYVDILSGYNPAIDRNELLNLLKRLTRKDISESEMVHLAGEAAKWIDP